MKIKFSLLTALFVLSILLQSYRSLAQQPFTIKQLQLFCWMSQSDFIDAMKAYPEFIEDVAKHTETECYFSKTITKDKNIWICSSFNQSTGNATIRVSGNISTADLKSFIDDIQKSESYAFAETTGAHVQRLTHSVYVVDIINDDSVPINMILIHIKL